MRLRSEPIVLRCIRATQPGALSTLAQTTALQLRSAGAGVDTGAITLDLPGAALGWLVQCGKQFDIAIDRPPEIAVGAPVGLAGLDNKWKISGWDASELRGGEG